MPNTVPLIKPDLPTFALLEAAFREILENGRVTNFGRYVTQFEEEVSADLQTPAVAVSSGTIGLIFALHALGLQPGQKVILPSFTFVATAQAVLHAGGIPIFADIDEDLTLSSGDLELLLARHRDVAVVLPVHMYGLPCQVVAIQDVADAAARRTGAPISVLYDAAHAYGSALNGCRVGNFGDAEVFSLSVTKVLVSVEGGLVSSKNPALLHRIRKMRNYGIESQYNAHWPGLNGKMSEFHAIVGLYNLRRVANFVAERQCKARYYYEHIGAKTSFRTLVWPHGVVHTFKDFTIMVPETLAERREEVMRLLQERGVETRAYFSPPVHEQEFFRRYADRPLPRTEQFARQVIAVPFSTTITAAEMDTVVSALAEAERILT
jgi:dTDP-4-amino-4,6-dideoxygalactose transaminase